MKFVETSAKSSKNVEEAFVLMTKEIISQMVDKEKTMSKKETIGNQKNLDLKKPQTKIDMDNKYFINNIILDAVNRKNY
jgi:hypothetical protein